MKMDENTYTNRGEDKMKGRLFSRNLICLASCLVILLLAFGSGSAEASWPRVVLSKDGTPISYEVFGAGEPTLVFVHGWSCDGRYWRFQAPYFSKDHRVVVVDLAGHGHSGLSRSKYTMKDFGEDVRAVVDAVGSRSVILIGHSMGGTVNAEAAWLMPDRVIGLIGIDTLQNIEYPLTPEELKNMIAPLEKDFPSGSRQFVEQMILPGTDPELREWILSDISSAPSAVALSSLNCLMSGYITVEASKIFDKIKIPVVTVNADMWPVDYEANRRHMKFFETITLKGAGHFLMLNHPEEFNRALEQAIRIVSKNSKIVPDRTAPDNVP